MAERIPVCHICGNNRQVWQNSAGQPFVCHRATHGNVIVKVDQPDNGRLPASTRRTSRTNNKRVITLRLPFIITLVFVTLKLCSVIEWSWLWVFSPLWIYFLIVISVTAFVIGAAILVAAMAVISKVK